MRSIKLAFITTSKFGNSVVGESKNLTNKFREEQQSPLTRIGFFFFCYGFIDCINDYWFHAEQY